MERYWWLGRYWKIFARRRHCFFLCFFFFFSPIALAFLLYFGFAWVLGVSREFLGICWVGVLSGRFGCLMRLLLFVGMWVSCEFWVLLYGFWLL
jgi:hypothetical protein